MREADWRTVGAMIAAVHAIDRDILPADYPLPPGEAFPWWQLDDELADVAGVVDPQARDALAASIERHAGWANRRRTGRLPRRRAPR